jgi:hypothetical protein
MSSGDRYDPDAARLQLFQLGGGVLGGADFQFLLAIDDRVEAIADGGEFERDRGVDMRVVALVRLRYAGSSLLGAGVAGPSQLNVSAHALLLALCIASNLPWWPSSGVLRDVPPPPVHGSTPGHNPRLIYYPANPRLKHANAHSVLSSTRISLQSVRLL